MRTVKYAGIQMSCTGSVQENIEKAERLVREAAADGAQIILLPELFENWYFCQERNYESYKLAKPLMENDAVLHFQKVAKELSVVLPISFYERDINVYYNSVAVIDADGSILGVYRKIPDSRCGIRNTRELASGYAGTSGFRRLRGEWRYRGRSYYFIRQL